MRLFMKKMRYIERPLNKDINPFNIKIIPRCFHCTLTSKCTIESNIQDFPSVLNDHVTKAAHILYRIILVSFFFFSNITFNFTYLTS